MPSHIYIYILYININLWVGSSDPRITDPRIPRSAIPRSHGPRLRRWEAMRNDPNVQVSNSWSLEREVTGAAKRLGGFRIGERWTSH